MTDDYPIVVAGYTIPDAERTAREYGLDPSATRLVFVETSTPTGRRAVQGLRFSRVVWSLYAASGKYVDDLVRELSYWPFLAKDIELYGQVEEVLSDEGASTRP